LSGPWRDYSGLWLRLPAAIAMLLPRCAGASVRHAGQAHAPQARPWRHATLRRCRIARTAET
jgi:hypothetical protein